jgi:hypothetical protein
MMPMDFETAAFKLALAAETLPKKIPEMLELKSDDGPEQPERANGHD